MSHEALINDLRLWRELGWIRLLDEHFADFLSGMDRQAAPSVLLAAAMASHQLGKGHVCLDLAGWIADPAGYLGLPPEDAEPIETEDPTRTLRRSEAEERLQIRLQALDHAGMEQALQESALVGTPTNKAATPLVLDHGKLYLRRTWLAETGIVKAIAALAGAQAMAPSAESVRRTIREIFGGKGRLLTVGQSEPDWQQVACALAVRSGLTIVTGGPGTGKTWTVVRIIALLQMLHPEQATRPLRIRLAAPTGKAAQRLTESINAGWQELSREQQQVGLLAPEPASTLHRLLGSQYHTRHFRHDRSNPVPADVVIVDEASMIDQELMHCLLDALAPSTRLILLGDKDQLSSVEAGAVFGDLCRDADRLGYSAELSHWLEGVLGVRPEGQGVGGLADHRVMLRRNRRSTAAINQLATAVNAGEAETAIQLLREHDGDELAWPVIDMEQQTGLKELVFEGYRSYLDEIKAARPTVANPTESDIDNWARHCLAVYGRFQVLTALKRGPWGVEGINRKMQEWLSASRIVRKTEAGGEWFHGRPVMMTRNDYSTGLMNGDIGLCLSVPSDGDSVLRVVFPGAGERLRYFSPSRLRDCQTAWAMTVHKSQGSEFTHAVLILPDQPSRVLARELIYTGLTRARERFTLVAPDEDVFRQAIRHRTQRSSALAERLMQA